MSKHVHSIERGDRRGWPVERCLFAEGAKPTDPQIAHIAYTAGVIDVAAAKQALAKTSNKDVKEFAENMVRDHEAVNKQALDLVKKLKVTPEDNDTSKSLSKNAAAKLDELAKLKGAYFDKAYVANEVAYHKAVDGALETLLLPSKMSLLIHSMVSPTFAEASAGEITRFSIVIWMVAAPAEMDVSIISAATIGTIHLGVM